MEELVPILPHESDGKLSRKSLSKPATYALIHPATSGVYVGSTGDLYKRIATHHGHLRARTHSSRALQAAFDLDPKFDLRFKLTASKKEAECGEQQLLDQFMSSGKLLNVATDARNAGVGHVLSDEVKAKLSQSTKQQLASAEARAKQSERSSELWRDPAYRAKHLTRPVGSAQRDQMSSTTKGLWADPVYAAKMLKDRAARRVPVVVDGITYSCVGEAASNLGIRLNTLKTRLSRAKTLKGEKI